MANVVGPSVKTVRERTSTEEWNGRCLPPFQTSDVRVQSVCWRLPVVLLFLFAELPYGLKPSCDHANAISHLRRDFGRAVYSIRSL